MSNPSVKPAKLAIRWSSAARRSLDQTIAHINEQDVSAGELILLRLQNALDVIVAQPGIGTPTDRRDTRRFPIPKTGHTIDYRVRQSEIMVTRWARQRRNG
ncbi:type II toxin-antitoxin system RelE/ParE family toxin [Duganella violaceipulchra]|uniref:Type II toxin-antitoxin system RelE/ParE family toxin n=1 Tax=Duganella violaceipulchra TaxID=2849652 RepID=A0AA41L2H6_9BURK|nr:type II toxin-antitoxin system RelE/ParE family toxin [Duganella violaceicalia]MBV6322408.1 type II toxin-antitoxin system RelE/ParE family toxin [Duganella violaceicalia]